MQVNDQLSIHHTKKIQPFTGKAEFTIDFKVSYLKDIQLAG